MDCSECAAPTTPCIDPTCSALGDVCCDSTAAGGASEWYTWLDPLSEDYARFLVCCDDVACHEAGPSTLVQPTATPAPAKAATPMPPTPTLGNGSTYESCECCYAGCPPSPLSLMSSLQCSGCDAPPPSARRSGDDGGAWSQPTPTQPDALHTLCLPPPANHFTCQWGHCNAEFASWTDLSLHVRCIHLLERTSLPPPPPEEDPLLCFLQGCGISTHSHPNQPAAQSSSSLPVHREWSISSASVPPPTPTLSIHVCQWGTCNEVFQSSSDLTKHISTAHVGSGQPSYTCMWQGCFNNHDNDNSTSQVRRTFTQRQKMMRHVQVHTGDRPFLCPIAGCHKAFAEQGPLTQHIRTHTLEKPYVCPEPGCGKCFAIKTALTIHLRIHSNCKPFKCRVPGCNVAFAESSNLKKHERTHTGEKKFECQFCCKPFARGDQKRRHERTVHATELASLNPVTL